MKLNIIAWNSTVLSNEFSLFQCSLGVFSVAGIEKPRVWERLGRTQKGTAVRGEAWESVLLYHWQNCENLHFGPWPAEGRIGEQLGQLRQTVFHSCFGRPGRRTVSVEWGGLGSTTKTAGSGVRHQRDQGAFSPIRPPKTVNFLTSHEFESEFARPKLNRELCNLRNRVPPKMEGKRSFRWRGISCDTLTTSDHEGSEGNLKVAQEKGDVIVGKTLLFRL